MSLLDDLKIPLPRLLFVSQDLFQEFHYRRRKIDALRAAGTHPADIRAQLRALGEWAEQTRSAGMAGGYPIAIPR